MIEDLKDIIVFSTYLSNGGAERVLSELMNEWVKCGHKVQLVLIRDDIHGKNYALDERIKVHRLVSKYKNKVFRRIEDLKSVSGVLKKNQNSVLISFDLSTQLLLGFEKIFHKNIIIFSERNDPRRYPIKAFQRKARDIVFRFADICVFQTNEAKTLFKNHVKNGSVIPNPVGKNIPELYEGKRRTVITAVCQLEKRKNIPMLIEAFLMIKDSFPNYSVEIYGIGKEEVSLSKYIEQRNVSDRIRLMGFYHNVKEKIVDSAMYISSSDYEGISNSMIEALAMGIPTICTDCPIYGARAMIKDGYNGFLVPVGDVKTLSERIRYIIDHPEVAKRISINAYKIREVYPIEVIAKKWIALM